MLYSRVLFTFGLFLISLRISFAQKAETSHSTGYHIHDIASGFLQVWKSVEAQPIYVQTKKFQSDLFPLFPAFYSNMMEKWHKQGKDTNEQLQNILEDFPKISTEFALRSQKINHDLETNLQSFLNTFPDMDRNFNVYVVHSFGEMDGGTRQIKGKTYFILGVDNIIKYHKNATTESPFFHHEFFHLYHSQHFQGQQKIWAALWSEGLATYVSEQLNPGASSDDLLLNTPSGLINSVQKDIAFLWSDLESKLNSGEDKDYEAYFLLSSKNSRIPKRGGYYLGYLVAKEIGKTQTLQEMARMDEKELLILIPETIRKLRGN